MVLLFSFLYQAKILFYNSVLLLGSSLFRTLGTIFGTALTTTVDSGCIKGTTDDVITNAGEVFDTAATDHDDGVLLKVVTLAGNVGVDLFLVGEADTSHLTHGRVRFFRRGGVDTSADTTALRTRVEGGRLAFVLHFLTSFAN